MIDLGYAFVLIILGFILVWISQWVKLGLGDISKATIILSPLILYLLVTGKISEFEGLGWKAKFREAVTQTVVNTARASDLMITDPNSNKPDFFNEAFWGFCRPYYVLTKTTARTPAGSMHKAAVIQIATAIRSSVICGKFSALVIVDDEEKPLGFFRPEQFLEIFRIPLVVYGAIGPPASDLYSEIMETELGVVLENPDIRATSPEADHLTVGPEASVGHTYAEMLLNDVSVVLITDRLGRFDGIITRSVIEGRIIRELIEAAN